MHMTDCGADPLSPLFWQVFELDPVKAWSKVVLSILAVGASMALLAVTPWYLLPVSWFLAGTAATGVRPAGWEGGAGGGQAKPWACMVVSSAPHALGYPP